MIRKQDVFRENLERGLATICDDIFWRKGEFREIAFKEFASDPVELSRVLGKDGQEYLHLLSEMSKSIVCSKEIDPEIPGRYQRLVKGLDVPFYASATKRTLTDDEFSNLIQQKFLAAFPSFALAPKESSRSVIFTRRLEVHDVLIDFDIPTLKNTTEIFIGVRNPRIEIRICDFFGGKIKLSRNLAIEEFLGILSAAFSYLQHLERRFSSLVAEAER